jgi:hypothetical protein
LWQKSEGNAGLLVSFGNMQTRTEKVVEFVFALEKEGQQGEVEDVSSYLDTRMCLAKSNKLLCNSDTEATYVLRKIKVGTWAKTSLREETSFVLRCSFTTSRGRAAVAVSKAFEIFSHQSQLPQKKSERKGGPQLKRSRSSKSLLSKSLDSAVLMADDIFGLQSLSDAALKAASSEETANTPGVEEDGQLKRLRLLEKADDLAVRIAALREEEHSLRSEAARFEVQHLSSVQDLSSAAMVKMEVDA